MNKYVLLSQRLAAEIQSGHYRAGDRLPSENELASYFGLSRQTVRQDAPRILHIAPAGECQRFMRHHSAADLALDEPLLQPGHVCLQKQRRIA